MLGNSDFSPSLTSTCPWLKKYIEKSQMLSVAEDPRYMVAQTLPLACHAAQGAQRAWEDFKQEISTMS